MFNFKNALGMYKTSILIWRPVTAFIVVLVYQLIGVDKGEASALGCFCISRFKRLNSCRD
ncbi:hypothetical protein GCM10007383_32060 [Arenibacter certesii]|uniref:Uncharacterized protein n=1 Tax=Arenibacter certesii TaxID=228955 RepID=A0A918J3E5_9FLAO|nr:hypothetical protein GCM10007383_32060 [Arenibacter certesii]